MKNRLEVDALTNHGKFSRRQKGFIESALVNGFLKMKAKDTGEIITTIEKEFKGGPEIDDESLDKEVRSLFYDLADLGILSFRKYEGENKKGEHRRLFLWRINWSKLASGESYPASRPANPGDVYAKLPREAWTHSS